MARRRYTPEANPEGEMRCISCGAPLTGSHNATHTWSLESLLPSGMRFASNLCPVCQQRDTARRIGAVVSARL